MSWEEATNLAGELAFEDRLARFLGPEALDKKVGCSKDKLQPIPFKRPIILGPK